LSPFKVEIIAEIANAHQGDPDLALQIAHSALEAGADAVKFQIYSAEELMVRSHPRFEHFQEQSFSAEVWNQLIRSVAAFESQVYCDVFGPDALEIARQAGVYGFKVHSSDLGNTQLLQSLAQTRQQVLLGVGGSTAREIASAVKQLHSPLAPRPVLLHGFQSYPTAVEDCHLIRVKWLRQIFGEVCDIGYADHIDGDDPLATTFPMVAVGMGATVLEKHITLNREERGVDYYSSLNPNEFRRFVEAVRYAEQAIGELSEEFAASERTYRQQVKKHWVTIGPLTAGHLLASQDLGMKRLGDHKADVVELEKLVGRVLLEDCSKEYPVTRANVPQTVWAMVLARTRSTRLPGKATLEIGGMPTLQHLCERLKQAHSLDRIVLCTTEEPEDDSLVQLAEHSGVHWFRGPTEDVLGRMLGALEGEDVDLAVRVTGDDILVDPDYLDRAVSHHLRVNAEYSDLKALPSGTEVEVFDVALLRDLWLLARDSSGTEYLTTYIAYHRDQFRTTSVPVDGRHSHRWRLTLDTPEDFKVICKLLEAMQAQGKAQTYRLDDIVEFFSEHPEILALNSQVSQSQIAPKLCTELDWRRLA